MSAVQSPSRESQSVRVEDPPKEKKKQDPKEWTLMVYMVSDGPKNPDPGDEDDAAAVDLDEIVALERNALTAAVDALGKDGQVHVAIQIDYLKSPGVFRWSSADAQMTVLKEEGSAADPKVLHRFYEWGLTFPAKRYALMFWGHSSGPSGLFADELTTFGPAAYSGIETLNLSELGQSVAQLNETLTGQNLEVVIFKDCFQSLLETAFELWDVKAERPLANYMVASQGLIPVALEADDTNQARALPSWPYARMLACLNDTSNGTEAVVRGLVELLGKYYGRREHRGDHIDVPIAALRLDKIAEVKKPLSELRDQLELAMDKPHTADQVEDAFRRAFRGVVDGDPMLVDVSSLCDRLKELNIKSLTQSAETLKTHLKDLVLVRLPVRDTAFNGVSIYYYPPLPQERIGTNIGLVNRMHYEQLKLNQLTKWHTVALAGTPSALARARYS